MKTVAVIWLAAWFLPIGPMSAAWAQAGTCGHAADNRVSVNESLMAATWKHFNTGDHDGVLACARDMFDKFGAAAARQQKSLKAAGCPYPVGAVKDQALRQTIFDNGVLNDVATAYFAAGRSLETRRQMDQARQMYGACAELTCARTWDPKGWFWSPAQACKDRLAKLP